jgi:hypothetical protein
MERIGTGQPEQIVACARHHAPGEAGERYPVDAGRPGYYQDSEDPEQREKEHDADGAQRNQAKHLTRYREQRRARQDQVQAEANRIRYPFPDGFQQRRRAQALPSGFHF